MHPYFLTFVFKHFKSAQKAFKSLVAQELSIQGGKTLILHALQRFKRRFRFFVVAAWLQNQAVFVVRPSFPQGRFFVLKKKRVKWLISYANIVPTKPARPIIQIATKVQSTNILGFNFKTAISLCALFVSTKPARPIVQVATKVLLTHTNGQLQIPTNLRARIAKPQLLLQVLLVVPRVRTKRTSGLQFKKRKKFHGQR